MSEPAESIARILLAEDDNDMRRFLVKALQNAGYSVASFDNGLSAYNRLREEPFELLLTDIVMPEMDGIELARRAAELDPDIKIMFITGFAAVALNPDSSAPKQAKVLSKPFHLRDDMTLEWPLAETPTHMITMAFDPDLDDAVVIALRDMIKLICARTGISREDAYTLCSLAADLRVTQVVNGSKGIHVMLEKVLLRR